MHNLKSTLSNLASFLFKIARKFCNSVRRICRCAGGFTLVYYWPKLKKSRMFWLGVCLFVCVPVLTEFMTPIEKFRVELNGIPIDKIEHRMSSGPGIFSIETPTYTLKPFTAASIEVIAETSGFPMPEFIRKIIHRQRGYRFYLNLNKWNNDGFYYDFKSSGSEKTGRVNFTIISTRMPGFAKIDASIWHPRQNFGTKTFILEVE